MQKQTALSVLPGTKLVNRSSVKSKLKKSWQLYVLIALPIVYLLVFQYYPMLGAQIAFRKFTVKGGIWGSDWVGFSNFVRFFQSYQFWRVIGNTVWLSVYGLIAGFPFPIMFALGLNYVTQKQFKKTIQMFTYAPYFLSVVVVVGMLFQLLSKQTGIVNHFIVLLGGERVDFLAKPSLFPSLYVWSNVWQGIGFNSVIYLAVLSGIDQQLHEAAIVDGANKLQRIRHIDLPGIMPTAIILLILSTGSILNIGFEKVLLMQNPLNISASEVINTYVYKIGLASTFPDFSYASAIGLFQSLVGMLLLVIVNQAANKFSKTSLW